MEASKGTMTSIKANSACPLLQDEIEDDPFLAKLPWPLECDECFQLGWCSVTGILASNQPIITITYSKLIALLLSASSTAKNILKKLSTFDIFFFDEAHLISLPTVVHVPACCKITIPGGYGTLSKIGLKWEKLNENQAEKIASLEKDGASGHFGKHLSVNIYNNDPLGFRKISAAFNELFDLARRRKELDLSESEILVIRDLIGIMSSSWLAISYIRDNEGSQGIINFTGNYWIQRSALREFLHDHIPNATHLYVSGTLVEPFPNFFSDLSGKDLKEVVFADLRKTNNKTTIHTDKWRLNSHNFGEKLDRILEEIISIREHHPNESLYIVAPNARKAAVIRNQLEKRLHDPKWDVDFYRSEKTIGVKNNARICIAIGMGEIPSNTYDHLARGKNEEERWIDSQRLRQDSVHAATWQTWSRVKDPNGLDESQIYCIGIKEAQARNVVKWGPGRQLMVTRIKEYKLPDGTRGKTPIFEVTVREPIKPPRILAGDVAGGGQGGVKIEDFVERVENYNLDLIFSEYESKMPIIINRQNCSKLGIYNNTRDKIGRWETSTCLTSLFAARFDCYALQDSKPDKGGRYGYRKQLGKWEQNPWVMKGHIDGRTTVGVYQISLDNKVKWICFDIDDHKGELGAEGAKVEVLKLLVVLNKYGIPFLLEASGSPNSYHIWILLKPTETYNAHSFSRQIVAEAGIKCEIFPKQSGLDKNSKYGNLVKVPLGINRKTGIRSQFLDPVTFEPYPGLVPIPGIVHLLEVPEPEERHAKSKKCGAKRSNSRQERSTHAPTKIGQDIRHCLKGILAAKTSLEGSEGHEIRVAIAAEAWNVGYTIEQTIELFKDQPDFNPNTTRKNVEYIYTSCYRQYSCDTLVEKCSSLISPYCVKCPKSM